MVSYLEEMKAACNGAVLILIVVEDGLVQYGTPVVSEVIRVLILIVVEDGLVL